MTDKKRKAIKTTRNKAFNYSPDTNTSTITSLVSFNTTKEFKNVRLYGVEDGISVKGKQIIDHANENKTLEDLGYTEPKIVTNLDSDENYKIYGAPFQAVLNNRQHYNNCGVESTLNTLAMAGIIKMKENLSDQKSVEKNFLKTVWTLGLVDDDGVIGKLDEADGGTLPDDYKDIFRQFDIDSESYFMVAKADDTQYSDINELAYKISQGHGAVVGVCSKILWQEAKSETDKDFAIDHAIAITGVVYANDTKPSETAEPVGFYIHDSGAWMTRYISLDEFKEVTLYDYHGMLEKDKDDYFNYEDGEDENKYSSDLRIYDSELRQYVGKKSGGIFATITTEPIKNDMFNLNATGDKQDNTIWGNSGDNIIKGMAGEDILYGNAGDDEIRGGKGNDIIIGNNVSKDDLTNFASLITDSKIKGNLTNLDKSDTYQTGRNLLYGDAGKDVIIGGDDIDLIYGGADNDYIWAGNGRNAVYGGAGNDLIIGGWENDRLFGDAGKDTIYGLGDNDTIHAGAGDDTIYGGSGDDRIETGKGNDTVYFEGTQHGIDVITSEGGHTTFRFVKESDNEDIYSNGAKITDMVNISLERDEDNNKVMNLGILYTNDEDNAKNGVAFQNFFNTKTGKSKGLAINDADGKWYNVTASKSKNATVSNKKMEGTTTIGAEKKVKNENVNNILFTTYEKGTTITTSDKNDIVVMTETEDEYNIYSMSDKVYDSITYTGGNDRYVSEERNTRYFVSNFSDSTNLTIKDNVQALEKVVYDENGNIKYDGDKKVTDKTIVSTDDRLYINSEPSNLHFFFDVGINNIDNKAYTTINNGLYILNNTDNFKEVASGNTATGIIFMDSYFKYDFDKAAAEEFTGTGFYGNGKIEHIYAGSSNNYIDYTPIDNFDNKLTTIAGEVVNWLTGDYNTGNYDNAFEAFNHFDKLSNEAAEALIAAYSLN